MDFELRGRLWKQNLFFFADIPALRLESQGASAEECLQELEKKVEALSNAKGFKCVITIIEGHCLLVASNDSKQLEGIVARSIEVHTAC